MASNNSPPTALPKTPRESRGGRLCDRLYRNGFIASIATSLFWGLAVVTSLLREHVSLVCTAQRGCVCTHVRITQGEAWRLLWLPLCPVSYALLTKHIIRKLETTSAEIVKLRGQMYEHKKA